MDKKPNFAGVSWMIGISALTLFGCSSLRHELFQSLAWDLGIFDQAIYLISQGKSPISSLIGFHILGDHAAWILYPLALLYKIYPSLLAEYQPQKELLHQYSLPILPFLLLAVINTLATGRGWLQNKRAIILWSLVAFLSLAKFTYFTGKYLKNLDNWQATREAIALVQAQGSVLTTDELAPHLSHWQFIYLMNRDAIPDNFNTFDYILINTRKPGLSMSQELAISLVNQIQTQPKIKLRYQHDKVYLFARN